MAQATIGISADQVTASTGTPAFRLGTVGGYDDPTNGYQEFIYGSANGAVTGAGYGVVEQTGFDFIMATTTTTAPGSSGYGLVLVLPRLLLRTMSSAGSKSTEKEAFAL